MSDYITHGWQAPKQNSLKTFEHITHYLAIRKDYPNFKRLQPTECCMVQLCKKLEWPAGPTCSSTADSAIKGAALSLRTRGQFTVHGRSSALTLLRAFFGPQYHQISNKKNNHFHTYTRPNTKSWDLYSFNIWFTAIGTYTEVEPLPTLMSHIINL